MTYGIQLEKSKFGIYYFRQIMQVGEKQVVKRVSLHTKDTKVAKFLAIQIMARIDMVDLSKPKKFEVKYDGNHQIKVSSSTKKGNKPPSRSLYPLSLAIDALVSGKTSR